MLSQREVPRINGSTSAFIALVVILVLIIIIACSATIYLLREDMAEDAEAPTREIPSRGRYQLSGSQAMYQKFSRNWFTNLLRVPAPRRPTSIIRSDKPRTASGQGWFKAGNGSDWDSPSQNKKYSSSMRMTEQDASSMSTPRSSNVGSFPRNQFYSSMSEASSSVRFDPHAIRGLSYGDPSTHPSRSIIPSIHSHMYSPPSSPPLSPTPHGSSRAALASSPEPMERSLSYNSSMDNDSSSTTHPRPPIRTFEGGTKFIEGL